MSNNGWVKLHRKFIDWEWFDDSKMVHLYLYCLLKANHKPNKWHGINIESGQFISSRDKISADLPLSVQQVRTCLNKLKSTGEITIKTTQKYSMISITNWESYQEDNQQPNQQVTNKQPASNQQVTTNKNDNNEEKVNKKKRTVFAKPSKSEVSEYILSKGYSVNAESFINYYVSNGWMVGKTKMKDWKAAVRSWQTRETKNQPNQTTSPSWELGSK